MPLLPKTIQVEAQIGDEVKVPNSVFRSDVKLYICHIEEDIIFFDTEKGTPKDECDTAFAEDCVLV